MEFETLLSEYGYASLYIVLSLGLFGLPIPNEVVVMSGAAASSNGLLEPIPAFLITYLGVCTALTFGYLAGQWIGFPVLRWIGKSFKSGRYIDKTQQLVDKHGSYALLFSYFLPVVRHIMPFVVGANGMRYPKFALFAYLGGLVWVLVYFITGHVVGEHALEL